MGRSKKIGPGRAAVTAALFVAFLAATGGAYADDLTPRVDEASPTAIVAVTPEVMPSPTITVAPPTATVAIATISVPTALPPPTIAEEEGTPLPTVSVALPTATIPSPRTESTDVLPTTLPHATAVPLPAPTIVSTLPSTSTAPPVAPLPSAAQLRASARLQFGHGVPRSVRQWAFIIVPVARKYGLDPMLVAAVITMESDGDPLAWNSGSDARGLMQVLHGPWDPRANIVTGIKMLAAFHTEFSDWNLTLAAYNAGPNSVLTYNGIPPYRETRDYVIVVSYLWDLYGNHPLGTHRTVQYQSTLKDLSHFKDQRKKVKELATAGGVRIDFSLSCAISTCGVQDAGAGLALPSLDPFWPINSAPDPLQQVNPLEKTGS
jgi:hypothetical protein